MAIEIKEYVGATFNTVNSVKPKINLTESYAEVPMEKDSLMVDIEAMHSVITRNNTYYTEKCLKDSIPYWTAPYNRPVIMHHNETDGAIIGRVRAANYIAHSRRSETGALELTANIGEEQGKKGIKNGTLTTVSIGVIAHDIRCSICGTNLVEEGMCEHEKGEAYDGKLCYWIIEKMEPKEVSYVIVPSDPYAHNIHIYDTKQNKNEVKESMNYATDTNPFEELANELKESIDSQEIKAAPEEAAVKTDMAEGTVVEEEIKKETEVVPETVEVKEEEPVVESPVAEEEKPAEESKEDSKEEEPVKEEPKEEPVKEEVKEEEKPEADKELVKEIDELKAKIAALESEKAELLLKVKSEKELKESALNELKGFKDERKANLIENINSLRKQLNLKEQSVETLKESSEEFLNLTIKNLTEFVEAKKNMGLNIIESPVAVSDEKDNTIKNNNSISVKEELDHSNNNFEKDLEELLFKTFK